MGEAACAKTGGGGMSMDSWAQIVSSVGFPIFVTMYLLWERRTGYHELKRAIMELRDTIRELACRIKS